MLSKFFSLLFLFLSLSIVNKGIPMAHAETPIQTYGIHHAGLAVKNLTVTSQFFTEALGFKKVDERPDYPAHFVSDGTVMITLWQVSDPENAVEFNRKTNIGLHHMAFKLESFEALEAMHKKLKNWPDVKIEFSPELVGDGPAKHMIFAEPGGIRLEFFVNP